MSSGKRLRRWHARNHHLVDPAPVHVDDFELQIAVVERVGGARYPAETGHDEARERVIRPDLVRGHLELELRHDLTDRRRAVDEPGVVAARDDGTSGLARIARQRAHEPFEKIRHRHQSLDRPKLVHHQREVPV
jgi:hypothetical protein